MITVAEHVLLTLRSMSNPSNVEGMARYGINKEHALGISVSDLRRMAKELGRNHELALLLWESGILEARILAALVDDPGMVTVEQMDAWVTGIDSWDVCDQLCGNLFDKTPFAYEKAIEWSGREEEFVRRAGFVLMATLSVHDKTAPDSVFEKFLVLIESGSSDDRNYVKKAVNWALRQIGKRNSRLNSKAIRVAERIQRIESKAARWIATDALRELRSEAVRARLSKKRSLRKHG